MTRVASLLLAGLCVMFGASACGSSQSVNTNYEDGTMTYESSNVRMSDVSGFSGLTKPRFEMYATASCSGANCSPQTYTLHFRADPGAGRVRIESTSVLLTVDQDSLIWDDPFPLAKGQIFEVRGQIVTVDCSDEEFRSLANAQTVHGDLGGLTFQLFHGNREPLRALIARVDSLS
jgi:hypothetical protein